MVASFIQSVIESTNTHGPFAVASGNMLSRGYDSEQQRCPLWPPAASKVVGKQTLIKQPHKQSIISVLSTTKEKVHGAVPWKLVTAGRGREGKGRGVRGAPPAPQPKKCCSICYLNSGAPGLAEPKPQVCLIKCHSGLKNKLLLRTEEGKSYTGREWKILV